jgi:hypothetical protein
MEAPAPTPFESTPPPARHPWFRFAKAGAWYLAITATTLALADHVLWRLISTGNTTSSLLRPMQDLSIFTRWSGPFMLFGPDQIGYFGRFDAGYDVFRAVEPILLTIGLILVLRGSRFGITVILAIQALFGAFAAVRMFIASDGVASVTGYLIDSIRHDIAGPELKYLALEWLGIALAVASMVAIFIGMRDTPRPTPRASSGSSS